MGGRRDWLRDEDGKGGGGVLGEGRDGMRGGSRAAQSRVKSGVQGARWSSGGMLGGVQGGMWSEARGGRRGWGERRSGRQCGAGCGEMGRGKKWRAKSLRTPFYQYSIYNQKDVLIIVLIILSHPLRSGRNLCVPGLWSWLHHIQIQNRKYQFDYVYNNLSSILYMMY